MSETLTLNEENLDLVLLNRSRTLARDVPFETFMGSLIPATDRTTGDYDEFFKFAKSVVWQWARERKILENGSGASQLEGKMFEEVQETLDAIRVGDESKIEDGLGDIVVVWLIVCKLQGYDPMTCLFKAIQEILPRTGHLNSEGVFVKDE